MNLTFVDLETTGATPTIDRITEVGIVEVGPDGVREWSSFVNPESLIPAFIQTMTGITNEMVADAPRFADIANEINERLEGRIFVAHNARFDYGFLKNEFRRCGINFRPPVLCTVRLSRKLYPGHARHNLDTLIQRHGLHVEGRHRALADAQLIYQFWQRVQESFDPAKIKAIVAELTSRPSLPSHLDPGLVDELPEHSGVYFFYGESSLPLYIGKAKNLRSRVLSHFTSDHTSAKEMSLTQQVRRIDWVETGGEIGALLMEAKLVKELQPIHNRQLKRMNDLCSFLIEDLGEGYLKPRLVYGRDLDFGSQEALHGLYKNSREANKVLTDLADAYGLCHALLGLEKVSPGKACFAYQIKKCKGACVGKESLLAHAMRLTEAMTNLKIKSWPFPGPAFLKEGKDVLLVDRWCYLGTAKSEDELWPLLEQGRPQFDRDTYRILAKVGAKLRALARVA